MFPEILQPPPAMFCSHFDRLCYHIFLCVCIVVPMKGLLHKIRSHTSIPGNPKIPDSLDGYQIGAK